MNVNLIRDQVQKAPFVPFRLHLSNGAHYDIEHPDLILLEPNAVHVSVNISEEGIAEKIVVIGALHITHVEPLPHDSPVETASQ